MSFLDVYIGSLADPDVTWNYDRGVGAGPFRQSSFFPNGHAAFNRLLAKMRDGMYETVQVDLCSGVAKVTKAALQAFVAGCHEEPWP